MIGAVGDAAKHLIVVVVVAAVAVADLMNLPPHVAVLAADMMCKYLLLRKNNINDYDIK